jgi:hypothetical protein
MTTKPTLIAASPGRALGYTVANTDYNNDVLQLGNYVEEVLAGTNADKIPAAALAALPAWTVISTFTNSWVDATANSAMQTTRYRIDPFGNVTLVGSVKSGTIGQAAFTLPAGYRPTTILYLPGVDLNTNTAVRVDVQTGGNVVVSTGGNTFATTFNLVFPTV